MPRLIDHDKRERVIAEAAWRVLARDGLLAMSVRNVAAEAGIATASLRRAFPTQAALRAFSLDMCAERAAERIAALDPSLPARDYLEANLWELLPFDDERRLELDAQLALGTLVGTDPLVTASYLTSHERIRAWMRRLVDHLAGSDARYAHLASDAEAHALTLSALLDGCALQLWHDPRAGQPGRNEEIKALLRRHLDSLARTPG